MIFLKSIKQSFLIFSVGGVGYGLLEILWRGYTHPTMAFVGGLCFLLIILINRRFTRKPLTFRAILCSCAISLVELISGFIINIILKLDVWDYSNRFFNIFGQICLLYSVLWFFLSLAILFVWEKALPYYRKIYL